MNRSLLGVQTLVVIILMSGCNDSGSVSTMESADRQSLDGAQSQLAEQPGDTDRPVYLVYRGRDRAESKWPYIRPVGHHVGWKANEDRKPQWIVQSSDYVRNEVPLEFLRKCYSNQFDNAALHGAIKLDLGSGQETGKFQVYLRSLGSNVFGYSIYKADEYSKPVERGRFENVQEVSFLWINASGVDSGGFIKESIPVNRGRVSTSRSEWRHFETKIPGADIDVIALDTEARSFVDEASSILLEGDAGGGLASSHPVIVLGSSDMMKFAKFFITTGGAPPGRIRFLSWEELASAEL